jgi:hypothetical protein
MIWAVGSARAPLPVRLTVPVQPHRRHSGKYAAGDVGRERSFYFRGPDKAYNIGARNLYQFLDIACSVDDATWQYHLRAGDYSAWFRDVIRDTDLAAEATAVEGDLDLDAYTSRRRIRQAVWRRYAAPGWGTDLTGQDARDRRVAAGMD